MNDQQQKDTYTVFMDTVDVINRALAEQSETPVLKQILEAAGKAAEGREFGVAVYKDDSSNPHDYFTTRFNNGKVELSSRGKASPDVDWKVSEDYLRKVSANPQNYVDNPAKLDIDWLKSRLSA
jgi:hypothetical protein